MGACTTQTQQSEILVSKKVRFPLSKSAGLSRPLPDSLLRSLWLSAPEAVTTCKNKKPRFAVQDVSKQEVYGFSLERDYLYITDTELAAKHQVDPKQLPLKWIELKEGERTLRGILVPDPQQPYRRLRLSSSLHSLVLEKVHEASAQLRCDQATEVAECQRQGLSKHLRIVGESVPTMEQIEAKIAELKQMMEKAKVEKEFVKDALFADEEEPENMRGSTLGILGDTESIAKDDEDDFEMDDEAKRRAFTEAGIGKTAQKKASAKPKAKAKAQATTGKRSSLGSDVGSVAGMSSAPPSKKRKSVPASAEDSEALAAGRSDVASSVGGTSNDGKRSAAYHIGQANYWMKRLDFSSLMAGHAYGNEVYQVRRSHGALEKTEPHSAEVLRLKCWLDKTSMISQLQSANISRLSVAKREEYIKAVLDDDPDFVWPPDVQVSLVNLKLKQLVADGVPSTEEVIKVLDPCGEKGSFKALAPTLSCCQVEELACARSFLKMLVGEVLVPLVLQGNTKVEVMKRVVQDIVFTAAPGSGPILTHSVAEAASCVGSVAALVCKLPNQVQITALDSVMVAREGVKHLLRSAIQQNQEYKRMETSLREFQVAHTTWGPAVEERRALLQQQPSIASLEVLRTTAPELPKWSSSLRPGATNDLDEAFVTTCEGLSDLRNFTGQEELGVVVASAMPHFTKNNQVGEWESAECQGLPTCNESK